MSCNTGYRCVPFVKVGGILISKAKKTNTRKVSELTKVRVIIFKQKVESQKTNPAFGRH